MKIVLIGISLLATLISCSPKNDKITKTEPVVKKTNWLDSNYYQAKAYRAYPPFSSNQIVVDGKLIPQVQDTAGVKLSDEQVQRLNRILTHPNQQAGVGSDCFYLRHGIVFWDKTNKPVSHVSVCFTCNQLRATPEVDAMDLEELKALFVELGIPVLGDSLQYEEDHKIVMGKDAR